MNFQSSKSRGKIDFDSAERRGKSRRKFADLSVKDRQEIIRRVQAENGLHLQIIEKDWWVTAVL